jgi:trk system potassium uptake protein TrkH
MDLQKSKDTSKMHPTQVLVLGFLSLILIGTILLNLPIASRSGESVGLVNALFTATSAVCVTGLVVVDTLTHWTTFGHVVILILIQIGGLGFMTLGTLFAFIVGKKIFLKERLLMKESLNQFSVSGVVRLTKYILIMTFIIEAIGAILLSITFIPEHGTLKGIWYSVFHSISAFCNAGFSIIGNFRSMTPYVNNPIVTLTVVTLVVLGGIGFVVILEVLEKRSFKKFSLHTKLALTMTAALLIIGFLVMITTEFNNPNTMGNLPWYGKILSAIFHSVTPRTAGFNTLPMGGMTVAALFITMVFMFIGGSSAGTAGGVKVTTVGLVIAGVASEIKGKNDIEAFDKRIPMHQIIRAIAIIGLSMGVVILVIMVLSITESNASFLEIMFESISAFGTVGLSLGITQELSVVGKIIISITMFFGRVGPLTIFLALAQKRQKNMGTLRYPEEKIIIG